MFKKKTFLLIMALLVTLSLIPTFADDQLSSGQKLQAHGLITGSDLGLMEEQSLTRGEMAVILSQLMGQKEAAEAYIFPANFTDVSGHWAKSYIAYGQSQEWFGGYPDGSYKPDGVVSTQSLASFILNALGYNKSDYNYDYAESTLKGLGITFDKNDTLSRGQAFDILWQAVQLPKKGEVVPLGISLGKLTYDDLDSTYEEDLKVTGLQSMNLFEYQLTFNQPVNKVSAENSQHYTITSSSSATVSEARGEYILSQDGKTLSIYMPWVNQNDRLTVKVHGVESLDGSKAISESMVVTSANDRTIPEVLDAQAMGSKVVRFTFSEALKLTNADLKTAFNMGDVTGGTSVVYPIVEGQRYHVADVTFNSDFPLNTAVTLKVDPLSDEAGLKSLSKDFKLTIQRDRTEPEVVGYELIGRNRLGLIWSKPVTLTTDDGSRFYHTNESNMASGVSMKVGTNNETVLYFDDYPLPLKEGYVYVKEGTVKDLWNNRNAFSMTKFTFDLESLMPVPQRIEVIDSRRIKVNFSTSINETHETVPSNFKLLKDGKEVVIPMSLLFDSIDKDSVTIQFSSELKGGYSLVVEGVKHYDLPSEKATLDFTVE